MRLRRNKEKGAALVEMAFLMPLLVMLLFGIIEFGWAFSQFQDLRHGAREAARLAAVDTDTDANMAATVCGLMEVSTGQTIVFGLSGGTEIGDIAEVTVSAPLTELTNLMGIFLPNTLTSHVQFRLEQPASNWTGTSNTC